MEFQVAMISGADPRIFDTQTTPPAPPPPSPPPTFACAVRHFNSKMQHCCCKNVNVGQVLKNP